MHNSPMGDHSGYLKALHRVKQDFYWQGMKSDIKNHIKCCEVCQRLRVTLLNLLAYCNLRFSDSDRSLNRKRERFKDFEVKPRSNHDDVIINLIIILNIYKH